MTRFFSPVLPPVLPPVFSPVFSVAAITLCVFFLAGCAGPTRAFGTSPMQRAEPSLELALRTPEGQWIHLGDLRGQPTLLFVFATWDGVSQAALRPLSRFVSENPDVHVVGVAAQPNAAMLLDPYVRALTPPFPLTYDPDRRVHQGTSTLGAITTVPTFIMLDAFGVEVERFVGFPSINALPNLREAALERGLPEEESSSAIGMSAPR